MLKVTGFVMKLAPLAIFAALASTIATQGLAMLATYAKFVLGFAQGVHAPVLQQPLFIAGMSAVLGAFSGGFGSRALAVHRCVAAVRAA